MWVGGGEGFGRRGSYFETGEMAKVAGLRFCCLPAAATSRAGITSYVGASYSFLLRACSLLSHGPFLWVMASEDTEEFKACGRMKINSSSERPLAYRYSDHRVVCATCVSTES